MKNLVEPIQDAYDRVVDFVVKHECEGCKRRRKKLTNFARAVDKKARDLLRSPRRK